VLLHEPLAGRRVDHRDVGVRLEPGHERADRLELGAQAGEFGVRAAERPGPAELLVNATSVGLSKEDSLDALPLVEATTVVDLGYGPEPTELVGWAERRGARVIDGLEILVRQGARSLERWTGRKAPLETMRKAVSSPVSSTSARS
jgi:shikimate 5-dehydrogenase